MDENNQIPAAESLSPPSGNALNLKALRESSGLSLPDIFETTRVGLNHLEAVENGDFDRLPPPVYARNFIRKYAGAVGIDATPILNRYEGYLEGRQPAVQQAEVRKPWPEAGRNYRFLIVCLAFVIIAGALVSALFLHDQAGQPPPPNPAADSPAAPLLPGSSPSAEQPAPSPSATAPGASTASKGVAVQRMSPGGKVYHLVIEARDLTWIRISEDRNPAYQTLLKPGDKIERMASDYFQLDIGNAGGIHLTFQGKPLGSLGKPGQIIHMRLPEKGTERKKP